MMLKSKSTRSRPSAWALIRAGIAGLGVLAAGAAMTTGCLDRPVKAQEPKTSNVYVDELRQTAVDKIDLLFMIDNSISMADKQAILAEAVPLLVERLITPICVRACEDKDNCSEAQEKDGIPVGGNANDAGKCAMGSPEFNPIHDIHIGVITSSLGSHGASGAQDTCTAPGTDEHAQLLGSIHQLASYNNLGFLKWDTTKPPKYTPAGDSDARQFNMKFTDMVKSAGEHGCGYEASLEAWYRFLIDPEPPMQIVVDQKSSRSAPARNDMNAIVTDPVVLAQRQAFLRPDSLVAIIMLSDENDCSIVDEGYGWLLSRSQSRMFSSTVACAKNPNDPCCQSCAEKTANAGCNPIASDPQCAMSNTLPDGSDDLNLRCWQQKRRFGFELLYPTIRYSEGLTLTSVRNRDGKEVPNPLYAPGAGTASRDPGLVFLAGIVGVPWQDIADDETLKAPDRLRYLTAGQMEEKGRWSLILGDANPGGGAEPIPPADPFMVEQPDERAGTNMVTGDAIVPSTSMNPRANAINGHEQVNVANADLQYACIFPLKTALECTEERKTAKGGCDCFADDIKAGYNRPLCQPPGGGAGSTTQSFAKAYPGLRHLQVLKELKDNAIVASICPKVTDDAAKPDYGYNPAVKAIIARLKEALKGKCLPRPLVPNNKTTPVDGLEPGQVPCAVVEAFAPVGGKCECDAMAHRVPVSDRPQLRNAVLDKLKDGGACGTDCDSYCTCEIAQLKGDELKDCQTNPTPPSSAGYCYINAAPGETPVGNADLVKECLPDQKRLLRFVGDNTPAKGAVALVACIGASLGTAAP